MGVAIAIRFVKFYSDFNKFDQIGIVWLISTAVCDTTIALALTWHLVSPLHVLLGRSLMIALLAEAQDGFPAHR